MGLNNNKHSHIFEPLCVTRDCNKVGTKSVKLIYINKLCWLCDYCKTEFEKCGLINTA
jgi:hypothetical protein